MDTPRARSPRPPLSSKPTAHLPRPPPPPPPLSLSAATSPSSDHEFAFAFSSAASSPFGSHLSSMALGAPVGRVGSDLSHISYSNKAKVSTRHPTMSYGSNKEGRDRDKNNRTPPFFSGFGGGAWRNERSKGSNVTTTGGTKLEDEEKRKNKNKAKRALELGQWVKKYMTAMVDQLRSSLHRQQTEREHRRQLRPHSFSAGRGTNAARETMKEQRERWTRRRGQPPLSSAPASLRVSPANSGHLSVGGSVKVSTSSEENTMEDLQSAIDAAIAHCKNSIARAQQ